jgi:hypothetical protein
LHLICILTAGFLKILVMKPELSNLSRRRFLTRAGLLTAGSLSCFDAWAKVETARLFVQVGTTGDPGRATD